MRQRERWTQEKYTTQSQNEIECHQRIGSVNLPMVIYHIGKYEIQEPMLHSLFFQTSESSPTLE